MMTVKDVMTRRVFSVQRGTSLKEVAQLLIDNAISGLPVIDLDGTILGVVSEADLLAKEQGRAAVRHRPLSRIMGDSRETRALLAKIEARTAADAMTSPAVVIRPAATISEAAASMTRRHVNRLPVVDDGRLVGIVTRADLVRAFVRSDDELEQTIRDEVLLRILWLDSAAFSVAVKDGLVTIGGHVERRSTADMVERTIAMVPGIVGVRSNIAWSMDDADIEPATADPVFPFGFR
jgi:CBS domain-containing protein